MTKINSKLAVDKDYVKDLHKHYIVAVQGTNTKISKTGTYGGVQIPLGSVAYSSNTVFELKDGKITYTGNKTAVVQVNANLTAGFSNADNQYLLIGGVNGYYKGVTAFASNGIAGKTASASFILQMNTDNYITLSAGATGSFSNITIYDCNVSAHIIDFID